MTILKKHEDKAKENELDHHSLVLHRASILSEDLEREEQIGSLDHTDPPTKRVKIKKAVKTAVLEKKDVRRSARLKKQKS